MPGGNSEFTTLCKQLSHMVVFIFALFYSRKARFRVFLIILNQMMFKLFFGNTSSSSPSPPPREERARERRPIHRVCFHRVRSKFKVQSSRFKVSPRFPGTASVCLLFPFLLTACHTIAPLPPASLKDPAWTVREGQAVWKSKRGAPEIAGEILVATQPDGRAFVQFTKTPFPFVIAQATTNSWQIELPTQNKRYSGPGHPPARLIWLHLPAALISRPPPKPWSWQRLENNRWVLENLASGESLEGYFSE